MYYSTQRKNYVIVNKQTYFQGVWKHSAEIIGISHGAGDMTIGKLHKERHSLHS